MSDESVETVDELSRTTEAIVNEFNAALSRRDVSAMMSMMSEDVNFEGTSPPDGDRVVGQHAVRSAFEMFFLESSDAQFEYEEVFTCGDRCIARWTYRWGGPNDGPGHVRGIDVFRVRGGKIDQKLSYVKG